MTRSKFAAREMVEALRDRSRTGAELCDPAMSLGADVPDLSRLMDLLRSIEALRKSRGRPFKITKSATPLLRYSAIAQELIAHLFAVAPLLKAPPPGLRFDPRVELASDQARERGLFEYKRFAFEQDVERYPHRWCDALNGIAAQIGETMAGRQHQREVMRHQLRVDGWVRKLHEYFVEVAALNPRGVVMRIELRMRYGASPWHSAQDAHRAVSGWLATVSGLFEKDIGGLAWKMDHDVHDGFFAHVVCVIANPKKCDLAALSTRAESCWKDIRGVDGYVMDCRMPGLDLPFRGTSLDNGVPGLREDLHNALAYLAGTDAFMYWDLGAYFPAVGFRTAPEIHRCAVDDPLFEVPRWRAGAGKRYWA